VTARTLATRTRWRWLLGIVPGITAIAGGFVVARHFADTPWPLSRGEPGVLVAAGILLLVAQALKALGWARLFSPAERPHPLALAAGNGGAALIGVVLPGRFDDAMRVAVVRRYPGCPAGVRPLCLSLAMLGLIDSVALAPFALAAALLPGGGIGVRAGLAVVVAAGFAAAVLILVLPRLVANPRVIRFRIGRWLAPRTTSPRVASEAWAFVAACWTIRAVAVLLILGTLGVGFSLPLALLFLCAGAASAALPIGPAGRCDTGRRGRRGADGSGRCGIARRCGCAGRRSARSLVGRGRAARCDFLANRAFADPCEGCRVSRS
jgi:hypothetical protein